VLVPMKALPTAKSRLLEASADIAAHARLVTAIREDTLAAATAADGVARVVPVFDVPVFDVPVFDVPVFDLPVPLAPDSPERWPVEDYYVQQSPGLNAGLGEAAAWAAQRWPDDGVAALVGDLPALRPDELSAALLAAAAQPRAHVADEQGTGTTLLTARPREPLLPEFGPGSAARHHCAGAARLDAGPGLRLDVDTAADLRAAGLVGLGAATATVLGEHGSPPVHLGTA
jgi:2-phospho-L-lactate guanylyltransferase